MTFYRYQRPNALLELLIVVAIIEILITLLLPSLNRAKEEAFLAVCLSNVGQLGRASQKIMIISCLFQIGLYRKAKGPITMEVGSTMTQLGCTT
ncbi:MAG: hypothetical protein MK132_25380 [Lentisphaerales bacterium]|nr:hypothetical protein [Lentisphaerales bacterium]